MKSLVFALVLLSFVGISFADETGVESELPINRYQLYPAPAPTEPTSVTNNITNNYTNEEKDYDLGVKVDAPNLVELTENWNFGIEGGKDSFQTNFSEGYFLFGKFTYSGTLFSFVKKEE